MDKITIKIDPEGEPIALIWECPANFGRVMSYQHIGQHREASWDFVRQDCKPVKTPSDVIKALTLVQELKSIGYDIGD